MVIAACTVQLSLKGVSSLKEKRRIIKSVMARLSNQFNIAVAEVEHQDVWQTAVIGLVAVGNDASHLYSVLEKAVTWIERNRLDLYIVHYEIELR